MTETGNYALAGYNAITYGVKAYDHVSTGTGSASSDDVETGEGVTTVVGSAAIVCIKAGVHESRVGAFVKPTKTALFE